MLPTTFTAASHATINRKKSKVVPGRKKLKNVNPDANIIIDVKSRRYVFHLIFRKPLDIWRILIAELANNMISLLSAKAKVNINSKEVSAKISRYAALKPV
jgi:hypothetical protein